ncbi:hypothetical protein FISHEDRAFT_74040 [Fistulina hepatica ATCC 64428]|uniref:Uncharacterized protein n=1 Tax=Fistulina hepatica ATCC 64428 TaxID=1128425 RepID=A0A0D7ACA4_9AGAR|nr:hypothetical protein FISHEDRAFT_74040 [Fistulina hepatica ATCC 64428]
MPVSQSAVLRPLRNSCNKLAAFNDKRQPTGQPRATYSAKSSTSTLSSIRGNATLPLDILPAPAVLGARGSHTGLRGDSELVELSRRVHAVCDSFRNVILKVRVLNEKNSAKYKRVHAQMNKMKSSDARRIAGDHATGDQLGGSRTTSLASMCAMVIGQSIELDGEDGDKGDPAVAINVLVPEQYHGYAVLSLALDLVLSMCPHLPALLIPLLRLCIFHSLAYESQMLLRALLIVAATGSHLGNPPLCHAAHAMFLVDLCAQWATGGFYRDSFVAALVDAVAALPYSPAWGSKAIHRFMQDLARPSVRDNTHIDVTDLANLTSALVFASSTPSTRSSGGVKRRRLNLDVPPAGTEDCVPSDAVQNITTATLLCLERCLECGNIFPSELDALARLLHSISICCLCVSTIIQNTTMHTSGRFSLHSAVTCLATELITTYDSFTDGERPVLTAYQTSSILTTLQNVSPAQSTFDPSICNIFTLEVHHKTSTTVALPSSCGTPHCRSLSSRVCDLQERADALCSHGLVHLEAALWGCALRALETHVGLPYAEPAELRKYVTQELVDAVDDAERRWLEGSDVIPLPTCPQTPTPLSTRTRPKSGKTAPANSPAAQGPRAVLGNLHPEKARLRPGKAGASGSGEWAWQWENAFECWVRAVRPSPTVRDNDSVRRHSRKRIFTAAGLPSPRSGGASRVHTPHTVPAFRPVGIPEDLDDRPHASGLMLPPSCRSLHSDRHKTYQCRWDEQKEERSQPSLLLIGFANRTALHPSSRAAGTKRRVVSAPFRTSTLLVSDEDSDDYENAQSSRCSLPTSDDALDLFLYPTSPLCPAH